MHPDLSLHLHSEECIDLIQLFQKCHEENKFLKFVGACNEIESKLLRCLKNERLERRRKNIISARLKQEKVRQEYQQQS